MIERQTCTGCSACMAACPFSAIYMERDEEGFLYPVIDQSLCRHCGLCEAVCPVGKDFSREDQEAVVSIGFARDPKLRKCSSSGGLFTLLAQSILEKDGVVFGCAMTEDCYGAHHIRVENASGLEKLRGSKYVQSDVENTFLATREALDAGKWVLYSGTPCQIAGLASFLGKRQYEHLVLVDVICHGVPSPMVWETYIKELEKAYSSKAVSVSFRDKEAGWRNYSLSCRFQNGAQYRKCVTEDLYLRGFIENLYMRPSCRSCSVKADAYRSDLTLGDCWSRKAIRPEMPGTEGVSVAVAHTQKGAQLLESLTGCHLEAVAGEVALKSNPSYFTASKPSIYRDQVIRKIARKGAGKVLYGYCSNTIPGKIRRKLANIGK